MHIYIGSDHGGFSLKGILTKALEAEGNEVTDCGTYSPDSTDYPDFAELVAKAVTSDPGSRGILLCRSGEGMDMAANKLPGIRAALVWQKEIAEETRRDNDANVVVLPADYIDEATGLAIAHAFIATPFSGAERHVRRLQKLHALEEGTYDYEG